MGADRRRLFTLEQPHGREGASIGLMRESPFSEPAAKPTACPFCKGRIIDTLAKVITVTSFWRCRECEQTWTISSLRASGAR
jgi:ribosomal protein L37AE/L43A